MDLSKAFDSLPHELLIAKLRANGLDTQGCALFNEYLQFRQQRVKIGDVFSTWEHNHRGVPQGSVLGPLLFNIFLNDIFYFITKVKLNAYADDQQLYSSDADHLALYKRMNSELSIAVDHDWFRNNGLMANPSKFHSLVLGETDPNFSFTVDGLRIEQHDDIDLLGINIDSKLFRSIYRIYVKGLIISLGLLDVLEILLDLYDYVYTKRLYNLFFSTVVLYGIFVVHAILIS